MSEDSYRGDYEDPLSLNLYTYAYNSPMYYNDPSGHFPGLIGGILGPIAGIIGGAIIAATGGMNQSSSSSSNTSSGTVTSVGSTKPLIGALGFTGAVGVSPHYGAALQSTVIEGVEYLILSEKELDAILTNDLYIAMLQRDELIRQYKSSDKQWFASALIERDVDDNYYVKASDLWWADANGVALKHL